MNPSLEDVSFVNTGLGNIDPKYVFSWPDLISVSFGYRVPVASMSPGLS